MSRLALGTIAPGLLVVLLLAATAAAGPAASGHYLPVAGDSFGYAESILLTDGVGNYTGYTETGSYSGSIHVTGVLPNGTVSATYQSGGTWSNSLGQSQPWSESGAFTFSPSTYHYVSGTDNQTGYVDPYVWFYVNSSATQGTRLVLLNTQVNVVSTDASYPFPASPTGYARAVLVEGNGSYERNDVYGLFTASYSWTAYFDPTTGYVLGYLYAETDSDAAGNGFHWTDTLRDTSTSFTVASASPPPSTSTTSFPLATVVVVVGVLVLVVVIVLALLLRRRTRTRLPRHSAPQVPAGAPVYAAPPPIALTPSNQPVPQVVLREVVKVPCRFCGTLIDSTATNCPKCGAPRT